MARCLFCSKSGATREHVLALAWLSRLMPSVGPYQFDRTAEQFGRVKRDRYEKRKPEVVRRAVCAACNNGWMKDLDQATQPLVTAMVTGNRVAIDDIVNKTKLAAWICKVSVIVDSMQDGECALAPAHAHYLYREQLPPPGWKMSLAAVERYDEHHAFLSAFTLLRPHGQGYLATISIDHFVAQIMVLPAEEPVGSHPMPEHVVQLWPPISAPTIWPPPRMLRDAAELEAFGRIVAGEAMRMDNPPPQVPLDVGRQSDARE